MKNVVVQGLGFVGIATSIAISQKTKNGKPLYNVTGIELNNSKGRKKTSLLNRGIMPINHSDKSFKNKFNKVIKLGNF